MTPAAPRLSARQAGRYEASGVGAPQKVPDGHWLVPTDGGAYLVILDADLRPIWHFDMPEGHWPGRHAVSRDLDLVALSRRSEVRLLAGDGSEIQRFPHPPWGRGGSKSGAVAFGQDGRTLWAFVTTERDGDELLLIDLPSRAIVDRVLTSTSAEGVEQITQPDGPWMGWSVGEGQDGALVLWSRRDGDNLVLRRYQDDTRILVDISSEGTEYLTMPHSGELLQRHRLDDDRVLAEAGPPEQEDDELSWAFSAAYASPERILATAYGEEGEEATYLLDRASLAVLGLVDYSTDGPGWLAGASEGAWLTADSDGVRRWTLRAVQD
ncbi:MAG TPA: hypothetical protein VF221_09455 [Chloroflexota bacterium]